MNKEDVRFRIADKRLINIVQQLRLIGVIYFHKIIMKLAFISRPDENEKAVLSSYFGKRRAEHVVPFLKEQRKKNSGTFNKAELQKKKEFVLNLCYFIEELIASCWQENQEMIKDEFLRELYLPYSIYEKG